ncbi:GGDEF domain-containing protein [Paucibacter sp. R3-3]|uniref:diguanylate cyclase n=1 Tax=Roseateles agri TaxID=3098619 RepID=A0ABU5DC11_9BURK|nr:GGDEF domain-containing protein [Paucibacter sp. R3-3]MDY0743813.1 GGDEF domain-containing protein [Paucibacter sp. R3-3]
MNRASIPATVSTDTYDERLASAQIETDAGRYQMATRLLDEAIAACPPAEYGRRAHALALLAHHYPRLGKLHASVRCASEALAICEAHGGDESVRADAMSALSYSYAQFLMGRDALEWGLRALAVARAAGNRRSEAWALNRVGVAYSSLDNQRQACETTSQALTIAKTLPDGAQALSFSCLNNLAYCWLYRVKEARRAGEPNSPALREALDQAQALSEQATLVAREAGNPFQVAVAVSNLVDALLHRQAFNEAEPLLAEFEALSQQNGYLSLELQAAAQRALIRMARGQVAGAIAELNSLLLRDHEGGLPPKLRRILIHALYEAHKACGEYREALGYLEQHIELERQIARDTQTLQNEIMQIRNEVDQAQARAETALQAAAHERERARHLETEQQQLRAQAMALDRAAHEDVLTGLHNRRHAEYALPLLVEGARQAGSQICMAMLDVDHFKQVNDRFGHGVGDAVLHQLAALLRSKMRGADLLARIGGEEFLVVMVGTTIDLALAICERLREAVAACDWEATAPGLAVRVSIGLAGDRPPPEARLLLDRADAALYAAKRGGRDRVHVDHDAVNPE